MRSRRRRIWLWGVVAVAVALGVYYWHMRSYAYMKDLLDGSGSVRIRSVRVGWPGREVVFDDEVELAFWERAIAGAEYEGPICGGSTCPMQVHVWSGAIQCNLRFDASRCCGDLLVWRSAAHEALTMNDPDQYHISFADAPESVIRGLSELMPEE